MNVLLLLAEDQISGAVAPLVQTLRRLAPGGTTTVMIAASSAAANDLFASAVKDGFDMRAVQVAPATTFAELFASMPAGDGPLLLLTELPAITFDLSGLHDYHRARRALVTIGLRHTERWAEQIMIECDSMGQVSQFVIAPQIWDSVQRTAAAGVYLVEDELRTLLASHTLQEWITTVVPLFVTQRTGVYAQLLDPQ